MDGILGHGDEGVGGDGVAGEHVAGDSDGGAGACGWVGGSGEGDCPFRPWRLHPGYLCLRHRTRFRLPRLPKKNEKIRCD